MMGNACVIQIYETNFTFMKKVFLAALLAMFFGIDSNAQIADNTLGLRLGAGDGFGFEFSYQRALSERNRIEADLGVRFPDNAADAIKITGLYQWVWPLEQGFKWFAGGGAGIGTVVSSLSDDNKAMFSIDGSIGIEYSLSRHDVPIQLALDLRPELELINDNDDGLDLDLGLSIRYEF